MDQQQQQQRDDNARKQGPSSPSLLAQPLAAICLDEARSCQDKAATTELYSSSTSPQPYNNHSTATLAGKDVFDVLPPEIIDHVLSFVAIPTLLECTVLSRRWSRRVLPQLWRAPSMLYYASWTKLLQHLSTSPLPLRERRAAVTGNHNNGIWPQSDDSRSSQESIPTTATTVSTGSSPPPLSPNQSPPLAHRRLSSQFASSSCSSSTTSYLYRFPTLDRLSASPPTQHSTETAVHSSSWTATTPNPWTLAAPYHPLTGNHRRRPSYDDDEQQDQVLAAILGGVPRYAHYIRVLDFSQLYYMVSDRLLTSLIVHTPFLTCLIVEAPKQLSDDTLLRMASSAMLCRHLRRLELHQCRRVSERGLSALVLHCTRLETIRLSGGTPVTDKVVHQMAHSLAPTLKRVDLSNATLVTGADPGLMSLAVWCQRDWTTPVMAIPSAALPATCSSFPAIASMIPITTTTITSIAATITPAGLVDCRFSGCQGVTDDLIARLSNLEVLHVAHCHELTDRAMYSLAQRSPTLVELDITACWAITDSGICAVGRGCPNLRRLILEEPTIQDANPGRSSPSSSSSSSSQQQQQQQQQQHHRQQHAWPWATRSHLMVLSHQPLLSTTTRPSVPPPSATEPPGLPQDPSGLVPPMTSRSAGSDVSAVGSNEPAGSVPHPPPHPTLEATTATALQHHPSSSSSSSSSTGSSITASPASSSSDASPTRHRISKDALRAFAWGEQVLQRRTVTHGWKSARIF